MFSAEDATEWLLVINKKADVARTNKNLPCTRIVDEMNLSGDLLRDKILRKQREPGDVTALLKPVTEFLPDACPLQFNDLRTSKLSVIIRLNCAFKCCKAFKLIIRKWSANNVEGTIYCSENEADHVTGDAKRNVTGKEKESLIKKAELLKPKQLMNEDWLESNDRIIMNNNMEKAGNDTLYKRSG